MNAAGWIILALALLLVVAVIVAIVLWQRAKRAGGSPPVAQVDAQLEIAKVRAEVQALVAQQGAQAAMAAVRVQYQVHLDALSAAQAEQARLLESDPVNLAVFLVQAGRAAKGFLLCLLTGLLVLGLPGRASAQPAGPAQPAGVTAEAANPATVCDAGDARKCSTPMTSGQAAPYAGQLLTPKLAVDLGQWAAGCDARLQLEEDRLQRSAQVELDLERRLRANDQTAAAERERNLKEALEQARAAQEDPWYEHPAFVATVSVVLTVGLTVAVGYALQATGDWRQPASSSSTLRVDLFRVNPRPQPALLRF